MSSELDIGEDAGTQLTGEEGVRSVYAEYRGTTVGIRGTLMLISVMQIIDVLTRSDLRIVRNEAKRCKTHMMTNKEGNANKGEIAIELSLMVNHPEINQRVGFIVLSCIA